MRRSTAKTSAPQSWLDLQPHLVVDDGSASPRWDVSSNPLNRSPLLHARADAASRRIVSRVTDCAVLRVTDVQGRPSCVPFIRVEWLDTLPGQVSAAAPSLSPWMPLWCFHSLCLDTGEFPIPPIPGNHSVVMQWLIDSLARNCYACRERRAAAAAATAAAAPGTPASRCPTHSLPPPGGGGAVCTMRKNRSRQLTPLAHLSTVSTAAFSPVAAGWDPTAPGGWLHVAFLVPSIDKCGDATVPPALYSGSSAYRFRSTASAVAVRR